MPGRQNFGHGDQGKSGISIPFEVAHQEVKIACSIGVAILEQNGEELRLIPNADAAMYAAKRVGRASVAFFEEHMVVDASQHLILQSDLRAALDRKQFELYYQPKIDARHHRISGVEALLRWNHPTRGIVPPNDFIPLAERSGLIIGIGKWVLDEACRQIAVWHAEGRNLRVAVNISVLQLGDPSFVNDVKASLARHSVDASQLLCEVTESVLMQDVQAAARVLEGLRAIGVHLSIDDFGTGYSSLNQLKNLPARQLKIDRSFVQELETKGEARAVVKSLIQLAHAMRLTVIAEGVETTGQQDVLTRLGCVELQGFLYARPMKATLMRSWTLDARMPASRGIAIASQNPQTAA